jgi:hypothetical protein
MSKAYAVVVGGKVCVAAGSTTVVGWVSGYDVIARSSAFFPSLAANLRVATIGQGFLTASRSRQSLSREIPNLFVHHVLQITNHFHQFHLRVILD